jgi:Flp pilus assembly protein protease CpaA
MKKSMIVILVSIVLLIVFSVLAYTKNSPLFAWLWMIPGISLVLGIISYNGKS